MGRGYGSRTSLTPPPYPQGNDITLVAYQPDLPPGTPHDFEIVFREVGAGTCLWSPAPGTPWHLGGGCRGGAPPNSTSLPAAILAAAGWAAGHAGASPDGAGRPGRDPDPCHLLHQHGRVQHCRCQHGRGRAPPAWPPPSTGGGGVPLPPRLPRPLLPGEPAPGVPSVLRVCGEVWGGHGAEPPHPCSFLQDCAPGYTRTGGGLYLGHCELCECNGHSETCHPESGLCSVSPPGGVMAPCGFLGCWGRLPVPCTPILLPPPPLPGLLAQHGRGLL